MGDTIISVTAGFCAGITEVLIGHPFDTIKTRIQTQGAERVGEKNVYKGIRHSAQALIQKEGLAGLYKGIVSPLLQNAAGVALMFGAMDWLKEHAGASIFAPHRFILACILIGTLESIIYCPLDHVKARLQVGAARRARHSGNPPSGRTTAEIQVVNSLNIFRSIIKVKGLLGLYHGWIFQWLKEVSGDVALFGVYDVVLLLLGDPNAGRGGSRHAHPEGLHWLHIWPAGSLAGIAYYAVGYPFDTIKSRMQTDSLTYPRYKSSLHAAQQILHERGSWKELYRGISTCILRAIPGSAAQFIVFELVYSTLSMIASAHATLKPHMSNLEHLAYLDHFM